MGGFSGTGITDNEKYVKRGQALIIRDDPQRRKGVAAANRDGQGRSGDRTWRRLYGRSWPTWVQIKHVCMLPAGQDPSQTPLPEIHSLHYPQDLDSTSIRRSWQSAYGYFKHTEVACPVLSGGRDVEHVRRFFRDVFSVLHPEHVTVDDLKIVIIAS